MYSLPARPAFARSDSQPVARRFLSTYFFNSAKIRPCIRPPPDLDAVQVRLDLGRREGLAEQVALETRAAAGFQEGSLLFRLDAFRYHVQAQAPGHGQDGVDDGRVVGIVGQVLHERAIDLQAVETETLQVTEGGITRAEVVQGELHPETARALQPPAHLFGV